VAFVRTIQGRHYMIQSYRDKTGKVRQRSLGRLTDAQLREHRLSLQRQRRERERELRFVVKLNPMPKGRPRLGRGGQVYTPSRTRSYEDGVALLMKNAHLPGVPWDGPVAVELAFYRGDNIHCDIDNLCKSFLDSANGILWGDDSQVERLVATKSMDPGNPRTEATVRRA